MVTDVWGRLPDRKATLIVQRVDGPSVKLIGYLEPVILRLQEPGRYRLEASIPDHLTEVMFFEVGADGSMPVPADQVTHWSFSADARTLNDADVKVHSLYLGLEHRYFAASGPAPRRGNEIELFDNGQEAFKSLDLVSPPRTGATRSSSSTTARRPSSRWPTTSRASRSRLTSRCG